MYFEVKDLEINCHFKLPTYSTLPQANNSETIVVKSNLVRKSVFWCYC